MLGFRLSRFFSIKCLMIVHPYLFLLISGSIVAFAFAMILRISDGPIIEISDKAKENQLNFKPIANALWVALVSMTTVGYGDIYPLTNLGRFVVVVCAVLGTIIVSLMVISLQNSLQFNTSEERAYNLKRQIDLKSKVQRKSVEYFMSQYKFIRLKTKYEKMLRDNDLNEKKLMRTKRDLIESLYSKLQKKKDFKFVKR